MGCDPEGTCWHFLNLTSWNEELHGDTDAGRNSLLREKVLPSLEVGQWWSSAQGPAALNLRH